MRAITRQLEPEWGAADRALAEGLYVYDADVCPGCGQHSSVLDDPENNVLTFEDRVCAVCAGSERHARKLAAVDRDWERRHTEPDQHAGIKAHLESARVPRPSDGRHVYLRRMHPEEIQAATHAHEKGAEPKEE
ncbi:hypothetical protein [Nocardioides aquiterrae]|uniref:Uncharacterized protein n=1 Tax=Nocardioides aquiterrae TaxID=203799 RepID=A0ABN1UC35_9ACTN